MAMAQRKIKQFLILCDIELFDPELGHMVEYPLFFYEDGTLEVKSLGKFKDPTSDKAVRMIWDKMQNYMLRRDLSTQDLRPFLSPSDKESLAVMDVIDKFPKKETFSRSELKELIYEQQIEHVIGWARRRFREALGRSEATKKRNELV